jgi:hypothetical protein
MVDRVCGYVGHCPFLIVWITSNIPDILGVPAFRWLSLYWQISYYFFMLMLAWVGMKWCPPPHALHILSPYDDFTAHTCWFLMTKGTTLRITFLPPVWICLINLSLHSLLSQSLNHMKSDMSVTSEWLLPNSTAHLTGQELALEKSCDWTSANKAIL